MGVTIKEVAKAAGVSQGTVSKALNDRKDVGEQLKKKIKKIAEDMGYTPNPIARRLSTSRSYTIGIFILSRNNIKLPENFGVYFLDGIAEEASKNDYDLLFFTITSAMNQNKSYIKLCKERKVDGAIFIGIAQDNSQMKEISHSSIPVVMIDAHLSGENIMSVLSDNRDGIRKGLDYLFENDFKNIFFISSSNFSAVSKERYDAYVEYMKEKNIYDKNKIYIGDFTSESGYKIAEEIIKKGEIPEAVFACGDYMALGAIKAFKDYDYKIPEDISVIGFDNVLSSAYSDPPLTTVAQDGFEIGKEAVRSLLDFIKTKEKQDEKRIKTRLIERNSVK